MIKFFDFFFTFNDKRLRNLGVDQAYLNVSSIYDHLEIYVLSSDCKRCPFTYLTSLERSKLLTVSTKHHSTWRFYNESVTSFTKSVSDLDFLVTEVNENLEEFGIYNLFVEKDRHQLVTQKPPINIYPALCATFIFLFLLHLLVKLGWNLSEKYFCKKPTVADEIEIDDDDPSTKKIRIRSIDAFRGFALCFMVFVNDGGGQYWFFNHSTWDGLYPADVLFPWFIWIMGLCIAISHASLKKKKVHNCKIFLNILQRTFILFLIGLSLNTLGVGPIYLENLRIPGVLQRIAICYCITSIFAMLVFNFKPFSIIRYLTMTLPQWFFHLLILAGYIYLTFYLPIPGCPSGYLGAGGIQDDGKNSNCTGGAAGYIDRLLLGERKLFQYAPVRRVYHTLPFDPENILGCLTSIFQTFLGLQAGFILNVYQKPLGRIRHLVFWSILLLILGFSLHFTLIPMNKSLWSLSFVFSTSGLAFLVFAFFYYIIDYLHLWNGSPFIYPGTNSILVYVGHELCFQLFPWHWKMTPMNTHFVNLVENLWSVYLWIVITFCLYKKNIFITV